MSSLVCQRARNQSSVKLLFFLAMFMVCLDVISIDLGNFKLKFSYIWFAFYLVIFPYFLGLKIKTENLSISALLLVSFLPSVIFSNSPTTSVAFFAGTCICLIIMLTFAKMVAMAPSKCIEVLFLFYRFAILLTAVLVLTRIQYRGHFILYEPSYYAVVLIPYFCMTFHRGFLYGFRNARIDVFLILVAIVSSTSVSMVLWCLFCFVLTYINFGQARWMHLVYFLASALFFLVCAYFIDGRTKAIIDGLFGLVSNPSEFFNLLIFVVGNRLQRVLVAYQAFIENPLSGVGLGALKAYSSNNFSADDFVIKGISATDFIVESNAANVFLELSAEAGLFGFLGFLSLLIFIHKKNNNAVVIAPFKIAFYVTMAALLIDSSYLRTYVWALYGIIVGINSLEDIPNKNNFFRPVRLKVRPCGAERVDSQE